MKLDRDILRKLPLALRVEIEENALRKALTQSELAVEQRQIIKELRKYTKPGTRTDLTSGDVFPEVPEPEARVTDIVGKLYGESRRQVERRQAIVMAAEAEPEKYGKLLAAFDRTGLVNGVFRRLKVAKQAEIYPRRAAAVAEPWAVPLRGGRLPLGRDTGRYDDPCTVWSRHTRR